MNLPTSKTIKYFDTRPMGAGAVAIAQRHGMKYAGGPNLTEAMETAVLMANALHEMSPHIYNDVYQLVVNDETE